MANPRHMAILDAGIENWNYVRSVNPDVEMDLSELVLAERTNFSNHRWNLETDISSYLSVFSGVNFSRCNLQRAQLQYVHMMNSNLSGADLSYADLTGANLKGSNLSGAKLWKAKLSRADLTSCILTNANLDLANLQESYLDEADLIGAHMTGSDFSGASVGGNLFGGTDVSKAIGLDSVVHNAPSRIIMDLLPLSKGKIPEMFLWGCGLNDWEIEAAKLYDPELSNDDVNKTLYRMYDFRASRALQISPLFISYSHADSDFVDKIGASLKKKGVRFWRDIHDATAGRLERQIDRAISQNPTVLLVLSRNSLNSDWVQHEVRKARGLEKDMQKDILCPVALDESWKSSSWPQRIMEQIMEYNILDFSAWWEVKEFEKMFRKLLDDLELFYKG